MRASRPATMAVPAAVVPPSRPAMTLAEARLRRACIAAFAGEGLRGRRLSAPGITRMREGGSFTARLSRGADRRGLTCVLDAQGRDTQLTVDPRTSR